jgi:magnesium transporter
VDVERTGSIAYRPTEDRITLAAELRRLDARTAARRVAALVPAEAASALELLNAGTARQILWELDEARRAAISAAAPGKLGERWTSLQEYPEGTVGRMMENPLAVFRPETTVGEAIDELRELVQQTLITYGFVTDDDGRLKCVFAFRDLLYADRGQKLGEIGVLNPFSLRPDAKLVDAMQEVVTRHYPAYPVCDAQGRLLGMVRGHSLFEAEAFEISAQAGKMQGISKEERVTTPWYRSFLSRHPWLQLNLLTAFVAGAVVGIFQDTVDQIVVLAAFLPVLAGQSGNTGCQALAVMLRGMTLGEVKKGFALRIVAKETLLGFMNGLFVGIVAGAGMWFYASRQEGLDKSPLMLAAIVCIAMIIACVASGISGALIPLALKKAGADPATASSIFLTTMTDVASMGAFLGLATWWLL